MPTRNVVLTDHQAQLVENLVSTGRYQNASEVLREGLRLIEDREAQDNARLHALRDAARVGMADIDAGRFRSFESPAALTRRVTALADKVIGRKPATRSK
jgi:antitoxin ParD1/3/4